MKVRRKRVNWIYYLHKVGNDEMFDRFFELIEKYRHGKHISSNRAAYYVLKSWYSTTTIDELYEKIQTTLNDSVQDQIIGVLS